MISAIDLFNKYKGQTVGTNDSDRAQCVGWYNVGIREQLGIGGYVIQGAYGAKDLMTATNTRPDLIERVKNNPNDPNQLPTPGDWIVWKGSLPGSGGYGHVAMYLDHPNKTLVTADQNWGGQTVHQVTHDWSYVDGWIHIKQPAPIVIPEDPHLKEIENLKAQLATLTNQLNDLAIQLTGKQAEVNDLIDDLNLCKTQNQQLTDEVEKLRPLAGAATRWETLKALIKELLT